MNFSDLPLIYELLKEESLSPISVIEGDKIVCASSSGEKYLLKECRGIEDKIFTDVFPKIDSLKLTFGTLELPTYLKVITKEAAEDGKKRTNKFILLKFYEGTSFNQVWNEVSPDGYGGRSINPIYSDKVVGLLEDFSNIPIAELKEYNLPTFDFEKWKTHNLQLKAKHLIEKQIITQEQIDKALTILNAPGVFRDSKIVLTNGDFYPRNFIELSSGKIVVIDWEAREDYHAQIEVNGAIETFTSQRNTLINYLENHLAFFFVHMWGNYTVQKQFMKKARSKFALSVETLQAGLIIKSLEQALAFGGGYLAIREAEIFVNSLNREYVEDWLR